MTPMISAPQEFHLSLRVADLAVSTNFYARFFGCAAKEQTPRYATFIVPALHLTHRSRIKATFWLTFGSF